MQHEELEPLPSPTLPTDRRSMLAGIGGLAAGAFLASTASAGPLTPPPGPISSTPGPEPRIPINQTNTPGTAGAVFRITQAGSYYLTENLQIPSGLVGIEIAMSDVTIELNGFRIEGFLGLSSHGIFVPSGIARRNITIRNGSIVTCGGSGIDLTSSSHNAVEHIHVRGNTGDGIRSGDSSRVTDCSALDSGGDGIRVGNNCRVARCIAGGNGIFGIRLHEYSSVQDCTVTQNGASGMIMRQCSLALNCIAASNGESGIDASFAQFSMIEKCVCEGNGFAGVNVAYGSKIQSCIVRNNVYRGVSGTEQDYVTVRDVQASFNQSSGIVVNHNAQIEDCVSISNGLNGIACGLRSVIRNNTATGNDGAGIYLSSISGIGQAVVEGNTSISNEIGIEVLNVGNIIQGNRCSNNTTNWEIAANNKVGTIVLVPNSAAISGNTGGAGVGSTNPHANFTY